MWCCRCGHVLSPLGTGADKFLSGDAFSLSDNNAKAYPANLECRVVLSNTDNYGGVFIGFANTKAADWSIASDSVLKLYRGDQRSSDLTTQSPLYTFGSLSGPSNAGTFEYKSGPSRKPRMVLVQGVDDDCMGAPSWVGNK
jgi:hypothetical protein